MKKHRFLSLLILIPLLMAACTANNPPTTPEPISVEILITSTNPSVNSPTFATIESKPASTYTPTLISSPTKIPSTLTNTPTLTPTIVAACPPNQGVFWSMVFSGESGYLSTILPAADGNYLISGSLDKSGISWVAKITTDGQILWQKTYALAYAVLENTPNRNFLLKNNGLTIEINQDGNLISAIQSDYILPNADGSTTMMAGSRVMRFTDPNNPLWIFDINQPGVYGQLTSDGGAVYAYSGTYVDQSVYYAPIYTDIKVIKIDGNGQVWERVYGKLVGDEYLEYMQATADGGVLLGGTHYYEQLGLDYDIWLMKLNQVGSMSWQSTLKLAPNPESIMDIMVLPQSILVLSEDYINNEIRLVKLTKNGTLAWQKQLTSVRGWFNITAAAETANGGILLAGETYAKQGVRFLARFDSKGNVLWEKLTGFYGIDNNDYTNVETILPLNDGAILLGGSSRLLGDNIDDAYHAWLTKIDDSGEVLGFLKTSPGKFVIINTLSSRPNTLRDEITPSDPIPVKSSSPEVVEAAYRSYPACLSSGFSYPTPQALPTITPSVTPTFALVRDLFLTEPENMHGDDVLKLQNRLLELGYTEVGFPDGIFGPMTDNAVRLFQTQNNLSVDGVVGQKTWRKLFSDSAVPKP